MARKSGTTADTPEKARVYYYSKCPVCGVKNHLEAYTCWKCDNRVWGKSKAYQTTDPKDAVFGQALNDVDRCMKCERNYKGQPCKAVMCFGTGRGKCNDCEHYQSTRHSCCQKMLQADSVCQAAIDRLKDACAEIPCA